MMVFSTAWLAKENDKAKANRPAFRLGFKMDFERIIMVHP